MKKNIMIDLDDTMCSLSSLLKESLQKRTGKNIPVSEWSDYNLSKVFDTHPDIIFKSIVEDNLFEKVMILPGVQNGFKELSKMGFFLSIVTARKEFDKDAEKTINWLKKHEIEFNSLHLVDHTVGKREIAKRLKPNYFIDDNLDYILSSHDHVGTSVLQRMPWNEGKETDEIIVVDNFSDFVDLVKKDTKKPA